MELRLQKLVCLNEVAIPFQESVVAVMHDDELEANVELLLLPLHVNTDKMTWLLKACGLEKHDTVWKATGPRLLSSTRSSC